MENPKTAHLKYNAEACEIIERHTKKKCCPNSMAFATSDACTDVGFPPKTEIYKPKIIKSPNFRKFYTRGDIPIQVENINSVTWLTEPSKLDYHYYLPLFFEGLVEVEHPYELLATNGAYDMIRSSDGCKIFPVLHRLILPMKKALDTKNCRVIVRVLKLIQLMLVKENHIGPALIPYYRQLLAPVNIFVEKNVNLCDGIDFGHKDNIGDVIRQTLEIMEACGGENAFINIKYMIPTYESVQPKD